MNNNPHNFASRMFAGLTMAAALLALPACQSAPPIDEPLTAKYSGADESSVMEFWHELANRSLVANDEAFHGLLLYLDGKDESPDYAARVAALKSRSLLGKGFDEPANAVVDRGTVAVVLTQALKVRKGVLLTVLGPTGRYADRELVDNGIYSPGSAQQPLSGAEFVAVIGRAEDYQRGNFAKAPAAMLPFEFEQLQRQKRKAGDVQP